MVAKIKPSPPLQVTTVDRETEQDPKKVGLCSKDVEEIWNATVALYRTGLHPAISLCLRKNDEVIIDRAIGHASGNGPGEDRRAGKVRATPQTVFSLFSASKAITAVLIHLLNERNSINLDDHVADYIPEFAKHGKHRITIKHILTHRAGIPIVPPEMIDLDHLTDQGKVLELLCDLKPLTRPGRFLAYHAITGGFILAEIIERVTGKPLRRFFKDEIVDPLGFKTLGYGVEPDQVKTVARHYFTGPPDFFPFSWLLKRALGVGFGDAVAISNDPRFHTAVIPSANVVGTANEVCRFYQMLLNGGETDGVRILEARTIKRAVSEQSFMEMDLVMMLPIRYSMGFMLGGKYLSIYGKHSPRAFGHMGFTNVITYADPDRRIAVCLMNNGKPFVTLGWLKWLKLLWTIAARMKDGF